MKEDISDSEIRVIGGESAQPSQPEQPFPWRAVAIAAAVVVIGLVAWLVWPKPIGDNEPMETGVFEQEMVVTQAHPLSEWLAAMDTVSMCATATRDITINDIPLRVYLPLNSTPHLEVGYGVADHREDHILFFQAADVRADNNKKIVGAFVLRGQPLSWGLSKRGYCAIIDGKVTVGVADNSPLFEQATEKNGDFFRQYPLVDGGRLVENELKNKSIRRALCEIDGHIAVVESQTTESLHDFAQALVDAGVQDAIYLVGSTAMGWCVDTDGNETKRGLWDERVYKNVSFIVWSLEVRG